MKSKLEILLVEDNPHDAELAIRALSKCKLAQHLVHVEDGQAALDFLFGCGAYEGRDVTKQPKIILLDLKLPKLGGLEVLRQLRADPRTQDLPVVVLSSSREDSDLTEAYRLKVNSYVVKPVDYEKFLEVVGNLGSYWLTLNHAPI